MVGLKFYCLVCRQEFATPRRFKWHLVNAHGANRLRVERVMQQHAGEAVTFLQGSSGFYIMAQPPLL